MNALDELKIIIEAHDSYAQKRESMEKKIREIFKENDIEVLSVAFTRKGFDVRVNMGYWVLDDIVNIKNEFKEFKIALDYKSDCVIFEFVEED